MPNIKRSVLKIFKTKLRVRVIRKSIKGSRGDYENYKETARQIVRQRLGHFNQFYGYSWGRISIKNVSSRWGSCSKKGNLNFSYKIALISPELADYIIVHELCHLGEFNHSPSFWKLVEKTIPNCRELREKIKRL